MLSAARFGQHPRPVGHRRLVTHVLPVAAGQIRHPIAMFVLVVMLPLIGLQLWITRSRRYTTVNGQFKSQVAPLGRWRWPLFGAMCLVLAVILGIPIVFSFLATLMKAAPLARKCRFASQRAEGVARGGSAKARRACGSRPRWGTCKATGQAGAFPTSRSPTSRPR